LLSLSLSLPFLNGIFFPQQLLAGAAKVDDFDNTILQCESPGHYSLIKINNMCKE
jgi:hypothetical protein